MQGKCHYINIPLNEFMAIGFLRKTDMDPPIASRKMSV